MKSNIILPPKIDTYIPYLPIENVAHFNANDNSLPYYIPIVYRYMYIYYVYVGNDLLHSRSHPKDTFIIIQQP